MVPFAGGDAIALTAEGVSSGHPRWSPDGKYLAFLSARHEGQDPSLAPEPRWRGSSTPHGNAARRRQFCLVARRQASILILRDATAEEREAAKVKDKDADRDDKSAKERKPKAQKPWVIDRLQFKVDEVGYLDRRRTHLYVFDVTEKRLTQITSGDYDDSEPVWSPDGKKKQLAFTSNRTSDPDRNYNADIWTVPADNTDKGAHLGQITTNPGEDHSPAWSPRRQVDCLRDPDRMKLFQYAHQAPRHNAGRPAAKQRSLPARLIAMSATSSFPRQ